MARFENQDFAYDFKILKRRMYIVYNNKSLAGIASWVMNFRLIFFYYKICLDFNFKIVIVISVEKLQKS